MNPIENVFTLDNFRLIIEHAPIGIVIIDKDLKWLLANRRFSEITGYTREELQGKTFLDITYKEDINKNINLYEKMTSGEVDEYTYEKRYLRKNGQIIWVKLTVAGVRFSGNYEYMIALVQDIDENKHYQSDLEYKNKELDTLFYKVSHDLKSPIASLRGLCDILRDELDLTNNPSFKHLEETIHKLRIQNELLVELTRINEYDFVDKRTTLHGIFENCGTELLKNVHLTITPCDELKTDPFILSTVFTQLLKNSIHFNENKPNINIDIKIVASKYVIHYTDDGPGIDPSVAPHIFDMFFKGSENATGSGLGLYISKKAIEKINGTIEIENKESKGCTFKIIFPVPIDDKTIKL